MNFFLRLLRSLGIIEPAPAPQPAPQIAPQAPIFAPVPPTPVAAPPTPPKPVPGPLPPTMPPPPRWEPSIGGWVDGNGNVVAGPAPREPYPPPTKLWPLPQDAAVPSGAIATWNAFGDPPSQWRWAQMNRLQQTISNELLRLYTDPADQTAIRQAIMWAALDNPAGT